MRGIRINITGRVQGVFFRDETRRMADDLGIKGWVRNCDDGSVEVHAEGSVAALKKLEEWCHRGPPKAEVARVDVQNVPDQNNKSFEIKP